MQVLLPLSVTTLVFVANVPIVYGVVQSIFPVEHSYNLKNTRANVVVVVVVV